MEHLILFEHPNFQGRHKHIFQDEPDLGDFDKITSSIVILEGTWQFFMEPNFSHGTGLPLGPGRYSSILEWEVSVVSSLRIERPTPPSED